MTVNWDETAKLYFDLFPSFSLGTVDDLIDLWWIPGAIWFFDISIPWGLLTEIPEVFQLLQPFDYAQTAGYLFVLGAGLWGLKNLANYGNPLWIPDNKEYKESGEWSFLKPWG